MVKLVEDYVSKVLERYPYFTKSEINKILTWGLKKYAWVNKMHADVLLCYRADNDPMTIHTGTLGFDSLVHYRRFITKSRMRERVLFYLRHLKWDGYYYIGLKEDEHQLLMKKWKRGKMVTLENVYLTKLRAELKHMPYIKHVWRVPAIDDLGWKFFREKMRTDQLEYIGENQYEKYHQCFLKRYDEGHASTDDESVGVQ